MGVVEVSNLKFSYDGAESGKLILSDVNLSVARGDIVILCGPSGSGKTTLLTIIGGLRTARVGSVKVCGMELCGANGDVLLKIRQRIGFIFQASNLLSYLTVRQNVRLALELDHDLGDEEIDTLVEGVLQSVGMGEHTDKYPDSLSGGQKQRVAVARALVRQPELVLADEPTASLDSKSGRDVVSLMHSLAKKQGTAIILVTHDGRILDIADRIMPIEDGRILPPPEAPAPVVLEEKGVLTVGCLVGI